MFVQKTSALASAISDFAEWSTKVPIELQHDDKVKRLLQGANQLLGVENVISEAPTATDAADMSNMNDPVSPYFTESQEKFWADPVLLDCITQIEMAYQNKQKMKSNIKVDGEFSFDIFLDDPAFKKDEGTSLNTSVEMKNANEATQAPPDSHGQSPIQQGVEATPNPLPTQFKADTPPVNPLGDTIKCIPPAALPPRRSPRINIVDGNAADQVNNMKREEATRRAHKPSASLRSPYYSRVVDITDPISEIERTVSAYLAMKTPHSR